MRQAIIIFTRVPVPGRTKTRLMPFLTGEECAQLHKRFIFDTYEACRHAGADLLLFYTPDEEGELLKQMLDGQLIFLPQSGCDLGERMENAFGIAFRLGYEKAVLIGTDIPQITTDILKKALDDLEEYDIVINPTIDGGYYLIGMTKEHEKVWRIEHYGTNTVIHNTLKQLKAEGLKTKVGRVCRDIDTKEDLKALYKEFGKLPTESVPVHTGNYLKSDLKEKLEYADDRSGCAQYECG